jgi:lipid-A-disaccharide synthase-like uncharacterized protein
MGCGLVCLYTPVYGLVMEKPIKTGLKGISTTSSSLSSSSSSNDNNNNYCSGSGISMSMTGFISQANDNNPDCINLLFSEWTLDTRTKFAFACLGVFCLGIIIQYLTIVRAKTKTIPDPYLRRLAKVGAFGIQVVLSYFLMLIAMTYSAELFTMVCVGLTIGYGLFHSGDKKDASEINADMCCPEEKGYSPLRDDQ